MSQFYETHSSFIQQVENIRCDVMVARSLSIKATAFAHDPLINRIKIQSIIQR